MPDNFDSATPGLQAPASDGFAITPNDSAELTRTCRSIFVGGAGNISLVTKAGTTLSFVNVAAGSILPVRAKQVNATGTTATNLIGLD